MAFELLDRSAMPGYYNATESSWGGYPVSDGRGGYALLHAQMLNHCETFATWTNNSVIVLSRSTTGRIEGPYRFDRVVRAQFAHNPTVRRARDGTLVMYMIGGWPTNATDCSARARGARPLDVASPAASPSTCDGRTWPKSCGSEMPGPNGDCCGPAYGGYNGNTGCGIAMVHGAAGVEGPWGGVEPLRIVDQWRSNEIYCAHTNPAPVFLANGTVVMAFNAGYCNGRLETIGLAVADHWRGPYRMLAPEAVLRKADGTPHHCEDPFMWRTKRGWHMLVHNQDGPQPQISAYAYSEDGVAWTVSPRLPYDCTLRFTDGSTAEATGCGNRPQLVFADVNGSNGEHGPALWLVNGAQAAKPGGGHGTWTLFRQLKRPSQ